MSYDLIKGVKIENGEVWFNCASNNVRPLTYEWCKSNSLSQVFKEKGIDALNIEILKEFESGNFQSSLNLKWVRANKILKFILKEEYEPFNWNNNFHYGSEEYNAVNERRKSQAFNDLLLKALTFKMPKTRFIIRNNRNGYFVRKDTSRHIFYGNEEQAKKYEFRTLAESIAKNINGEIIAI